MRFKPIKIHEYNKNRGLDLIQEAKNMWIHNNILKISIRREISKYLFIVEGEDTKRIPADIEKLTKLWEALSEN